MRKAPLIVATALFGVAASFAAPIKGVQAEEDLAMPVDPMVVSFVEKYCSECHNDFVEDGDRNFDPFLASPNDPKHHLKLEEMLEQLNLGKMPKKEPGVAQPSDDERRAIVASLTGYLIATAQSKYPTETPLRRLTNIEYRNTLRDLFGHDPRTFTSITTLPADTNVHGFLNIGQEQAMSLTQLQAYINVAGEVIDASYADRGAELAPVTTQQYGPRDFIPANEFPMRFSITPLVSAPDESYFDVLGGRENAVRPVFPIPYRNQGGAPSDGEYVIRVTAEALDRFEDYNLPHDFYYPSGAILKLGIGSAPNKDTLGEADTEKRIQHAYFDLADNEPQTFEVRIPMNRGNVPYFWWPNGAHVGHYEIIENSKRFYPEIYRRFLSGDNDEEHRHHPDFLHFVRDIWKGPRVRIHDFQITGPFPKEDNVAVSSDVFASYTARPTTELDDILVEFSGKAFRRPTTSAEIGNFKALVERALDDGKSWDHALKLGFTAILSSPRFLYLQEGNSERGEALGPYELASRLSYFLWSSMPDQPLLDDAATGALTEKAVLQAHVKRMLQDEKAEAFISGFANSWLRLDKLGQMPPDPQIYWTTYYKNRLEAAMRRETELVLSHILHENLPPTTFLTANFTFLNDALATHYGIKGDFGEQFKLASLPADSARRGIVSHASVLTASANGVETSPVVRGVWLLENLLGTPPSPAPPDVPAIEPDTRGATSIRELLEKHRNVQACADCHAHIDPFGFPLERFGPTGEFRTNYPGVRDGKTVLEAGIPIDASTSLATGERIETLEDFQGVLIDGRRSFEINLMSKLLTYGTGRKMTFRDRPEIDAMVTELGEEEGGFLDMITMAVTSDVFTSR